MIKDSSSLKSQSLKGIDDHERIQSWNDEEFRVLAEYLNEKVADSLSRLYTSGETMQIVSQYIRRKNLQFEEERLMEPLTRDLLKKINFFDGKNLSRWFREREKVKIQKDKRNCLAAIMEFEVKTWSELLSNPKHAVKIRKITQNDLDQFYIGKRMEVSDKKIESERQSLPEGIKIGKKSKFNNTIIGSGNQINHYGEQNKSCQ
ncbi:MAG: hypothetical protein H6581_25395 [Bacteroidia bacterium]|nr:hypothetical protein [Bacteroidia bacterium]